jgi:CubicO group peptidase (beta-lactamase class C family)
MAGSLAGLNGESHPRTWADALQPDCIKPLQPACIGGWHDRAMHHSITEALGVAQRWGAEHVALAVVGPDGVVATHGDEAREFAWASVTKVATAVALLRAVEEGTVTLGEPLGPPGATVRHLLAHASGLGPEGAAPISAPERTRIYSNAGFDLLGGLLAERAGRSVAAALERAVLAPLRMDRTRLAARASAGMQGPLVDFARLGHELLRPTLLRPDTLAAATSVVFPGLAGVLPGFGRYDPLDWGLGFELRGSKQPHWTGTTNSPVTFGHFGASGTFLWVDPVADLSLACLTDRTFGPWAHEAWPALSDAVLAAAT